MPGGLSFHSYSEENQNCMENVHVRNENATKSGDVRIEGGTKLVLNPLIFRLHRA